jgi:hypothetical protein
MGGLSLPASDTIHVILFEHLVKWQVAMSDSPRCQPPDIINTGETLEVVADCDRQKSQQLYVLFHPNTAFIYRTSCYTIAPTFENALGFHGPRNHQDIWIPARRNHHNTIQWY